MQLNMHQLATNPGGQPVVFLMPFWFGDAQEGELCIETMKRFAEPVQAQVGLMTYSDMLDIQSWFNHQCLHVVIKTRWLPCWMRIRSRSSSRR